MFTTKLKAAAVAATIAIGGLGVASTTTTAAHAGDVRIGVEFGTPGFYFGVHDDRGYRGHRRDRHRGDRYRRYDDRLFYEERRVRRDRSCSPRRALRAARDYGVRRAHIVRVGRKGVVVGGRKHGDTVRIGFGKHRSCPIRFARIRYY